MSDFNEFLNQETFGAEIFSTPEEREKREIKKCGNVVGISLICVTAVSVILGIVLGVVSLLSGNRMELLTLLEDAAFNAALQVVLSVMMFTLPFIICFKIGGFRVSDLVSFKKTEKGMALPLFFMGLAFCAFANIGAGYVDAVFEMFGIDTSMSIDMPEGVFGFFLSVISTALVPALVEEFAMRGIVLGSLRKFGDSFALVTSSICFGLMHGNFEQIPFAFMVGMFLGFAVLKTGSLRVSMAVHFANNLVAVLISYLSLGDDIINAVYVVYLLIALVLGVLLLKNVKPDFFTLEKSETLLEAPKKFKTFFLSGGVIVFVIATLFEAVLLIL